MNPFVEALCGLFIGSCFVALLAFLHSLFKWLLGLVLYQFNLTKTIGFKMMCMSALFPKLLPKYCPYSSCSDSPCRMWTCPSYSKSEHKKTGNP